MTFFWLECSDSISVPVWTAYSCWRRCALYVSRSSSTRAPGERVGQPKPHWSGALNPKLMDVAFAGRAHQCTTQRICDSIEEKFEFRSFQTLAESANYKYVMDVDGNAWSGRFKRLMLANSVIFKATVYPEW